MGALKVASVTSPKTIILFCAGNTDGSPDFSLYNRLIRERYAGELTIKPFGGIRGFQGFINGYLAGYKKDEQPPYIALRDRDFIAQDIDHQPLTTVSRLLKISRHIYATHRACIENYFIDPELIYKFLRDRTKSKTGMRLTQNNVTAIIEQSGKDILDYQAVRWALSKLSPESGWPNIPSSLGKKYSSGSLPDSLNFDECLQQAIALQANYGQATSQVSTTDLRVSAKQFQEKFHQGNLQTWLVWFHGKDWLTRLRVNINAFCHQHNMVVQFEKTAFNEWAVNQVDTTNHPDLLELVTIIEQLRV